MAVSTCNKIAINVVMSQSKGKDSNAPNASIHKFFSRGRYKKLLLMDVKFPPIRGKKG